MQSIVRIMTMTDEISRTLLVVVWAQDPAGLQSPLPTSHANSASVAQAARGVGGWEVLC